MGRRWSGFCQVTAVLSFSPKVQHQQNILCRQKKPKDDIISIMTWSSNYHPELFTAGVATLAEESTAAELALGHATTQRNCTYAIAEQAQVFAADAIENRVKTQDLLAEF
jgi:hypothetical protein